MAGVVTAAAISGGGAILGGIIGAKGAKDAAQIGADAEGRKLALQQEQYDQSRLDQQPYREVATGTRRGYNDVNNQIGDILSNFRQQEKGQIDQWIIGQGLATREQVNDDAWLSNFLQNDMGQGFNDRWGNSGIKDLIRQRDAYGDPSKLTDGALNELAQYGRSKVDVNGIPTFDVQGNIPQYNPLVDITQDPSYQFRRNEMLRGINRNAAGTGKVFSGNRLEEIMRRTGDLASQEYGAAYVRNQNDYNINRGAEEAQYGRDLTAYNANVGRENTLFNRQTGQENDYLNRLASLSNIGQNATNRTGTLGANFASNAGNTLAQQGAYGAAGALGQSNAIQKGLGDLASLIPKFSGGGSTTGVAPSGGVDIGFNPSASNNNYGFKLGI